MAFDQIEMPEDLRSCYLKRRSKDLRTCRAKILILDWVYFARLGHQLKGNASSYGYKNLGEIALQIENSARDKDLTKLKKHVSAFQEWLGEETENTLWVRSVF